MSTSLKKFLFGAFFIFLCFSVLWLVYRAFIKPSPSCFDSKKNQNEEDIDCGGPCVPCEIRKLSPPRVIEGPKSYFLRSGARAVLVEVENPNATYGVSHFTYAFTMVDENNRVVKTISGVNTLYPSERRWFGVFEVSPNRSVKTEFTFDSPSWVPARDMPKAEVAVRGEKTEVENGVLRVQGILENVSTIPVKEASIIAILRDRFNEELFAWSTLLEDIAPLESRSFVIVFPRDELLATYTDLSATKILLHYR